MNDTTSFSLAFGATALLLAGYMWQLEKRANRIEAQLATLAAATNQKNPPSDPTPKE